MAEELIDICDDNMTPIGTDTRTEAHKRGLWHVAVHCWVIRPRPPGHVLFARRAAAPGTGGALYDVTASGHPESGESADERLSQLVEELGTPDTDGRRIPLGIKIDVNRRANDVVIREFCPAYFVTSPRGVQEYQLDHDVFTALVELAIPEGLELFSGRASRAGARGVEYDITAAAWRGFESEVGVHHFLPRVDPYYYRIFIMAQRFMQGSCDLAV